MNNSLLSSNIWMVFIFPQLALSSDVFWDSQVAQWWRIHLPVQEMRCRRPGFDPGLGRSPGGGHGNPLQYSCLKNPMDRGAWRTTVHGVAKSQIRLSNWAHAQGGSNRGPHLLFGCYSLKSFLLFTLLLLFTVYMGCAGSLLWCMGSVVAAHGLSCSMRDLRSLTRSLGL